MSNPNALSNRAINLGLAAALGGTLLASCDSAEPAPPVLPEIEGTVIKPEERPLCRSVAVQQIPGTYRVTFEPLVDRADREGVYKWDNTDYNFGEGEPTAEEKRGKIEHKYPGPGSYSVSAVIDLDVQPDKKAFMQNVEEVPCPVFFATVLPTGSASKPTTTTTTKPPSKKPAAPTTSKSRN